MSIETKCYSEAVHHLLLYFFFRDLLFTMLFISREDKFDKAIFTLQGLSAERTDGLKGITSMRNGQLLPKPASKEEKRTSFCYQFSLMNGIH